MQTFAWAVLLLGCAAAWSQEKSDKGQPLVMDSFKNGVYTLHMGHTLIKARCEFAFVIPHNEKRSPCIEFGGVLNVPGDTVRNFKQSANHGAEVRWTDTFYDVFPESVEVSQEFVNRSYSTTPDSFVVYHFKILEMRRD
jgi:hypothetical protein